MTAITLCAPFAGWLGTLDEVADPVFAGRMLGDGLAIEPLEGMLRAPADAEVVAVPASAHAITLRLANGAELLLHIGLETVVLKGRGFRALVAARDHVERGQPLIAFDLNAVALGAKDLVTPMVLATPGTVEVIGTPRQVAAGEIIAEVTAAATQAQGQEPAGSASEVRRSIPVIAPHGLHARPAARLVALLKPFAAEVTLSLGDRNANARSPTALLALGAVNGTVLSAAASGPDAEAALDALERFAADAFGDDIAGAPVATRSQSGPVCASPGLAIGRSYRWRPQVTEVDEAGQGIELERRALGTAIGTAMAALGQDDLADAHRAILDDPELLAAAWRDIAAGKSAGWAWRRATATAADALRATGDPRLEERVADLQDITAQLIAALTGRALALPALAPDTILIAEDLLPSQFQGLDHAHLAGICTARGGPTSHTALLAAAAGVPMLVAAGQAILRIVDGTPVILDAGAAQLIIDPGVAALGRASAAAAAMRDGQAAALHAAQAPCTTADGVRIEVFANLGSVEDAAAAMRAGAEGCGLLRTELLFLDRAQAPGEDEQRALYAAIATTMADRPLIVRTLDIGADKPVPYMPTPREDNPALGQRGIRLSLARPDLFETQLRAILAGVPGPQCRIMLPMVSDLAEVFAARAALDRAARGVGRTDRIELGIMVETPAAALLADTIAREVDFLSIGTNDLTQYAFAADRGNPAVAAMNDALHPAVLRLIAQTVEGARGHGRWVGVCGGLGSDPLAAPLLVGLGVTEISAVPARVPAIKAAIRRVTRSEAEAIASHALAAPSAVAVRQLLGERA